MFKQVLRSQSRNLILRKSPLYASRVATSAVCVPSSRNLWTVSRLLSQESGVESKTAETLADVKGRETLIGKGAKEGTVPTDLEQATGMERLELMGKMEGVEFFDTKPLQANRIGTMADPIIVDSYDEYRYVGCSGCPAGTHETMWLKPTINQVARCWECGSVFKLNYIGVKTEEDHH
ncbi:hypothetical protein TBLA_0D02180 [Henningerozyma blattae CBS 6284]|uniref:Cytochrome c oxidase subunit 4, mitochondrial n=1 Tax=Henningerozyma blattae (strain ATCC 34711 / CBS 6284 / DSM 70876 / NBRC 10599 / NRRL Y-10934 / UCD 77-7) TaxID=1071380 RepID=I2H2X1_HENB6|nr:hypothetical protein TBLA_0D02180 [Tetrapisispora blattae CBS 6284]CCH60723.1 hypothetical protein TBLA_0D02180 [Tetrapisispora blattae CBS 6284]